MKKYCPPGVLCIENTTMVFLVLILLLGVFVLTVVLKKINVNMNVFTQNRNKSNNDSQSIQTNRPGFFGLFNNPSDVFLNPHSPPLKNGMYRQKNSSDPRGIPINIQTQSSNVNYSQMGVLTRENGKETILPLMGRPLFSNRDKWNFYTMNDKNNMIKLPITFKNKSCTNEYGCDNIYNGDTVYVEGYNETFKATVYDNQVMRYIPFL